MFDKQISKPLKMLEIMLTKKPLFGEPLPMMQDLRRWAIQNSLSVFPRSDAELCILRGVEDLLVQKPNLLQKGGAHQPAGG